MNCTEKIAQDLLFDCADKPKRGIEGSKAVLINVSDLDLASTTTSGATITDLILKSGTTGYSVEWYKELGSVATEFSPNAEDVDGFKHSFLCRLATTTAENAEAAAVLGRGRFILVVETEYKGLNQEDAFKVYGFETGMRMSEMTGNSNENSGSLVYTLSTRENMYETYPYQILTQTADVGETVYGVTKALFDSLFAVV